MASHKTFSTLALIIICFICSSLLTYADDVTHDDRAIVINGQRRILLSGAIHYPRSTDEMWPHLMKKAKEGGLDAIETYVFWKAHESVRGKYDFSGNLNLIKFIKTCQENGLYTVLRIGPYVCAEWNYGGLPVWLHNVPGLQKFRTNDPVFMREMQRFTTLIVDMVRKEKLFASQGGPVILAQIENEYGNVDDAYGDDGKKYINWCANLANSFNVSVTWLMCQQKDAPPPMLESCNGWYCDQYKPTNPTTPKLWTENWTGWYKNWGGKDPYRTAEDLAFAVARFFQTGGTFQSYYMYHGGTNFGRTSGGPYITTTYDYNAPLDEYGNLNQPKYGHLKELHDVLHSLEKNLTYGNITKTKLDNSVEVTVFALNNTSTCFISNANETSNATINYNGIDHNIPAWSVSILHDCKTETYNTAKVNAQTNVMVKEAAEEKKAAGLRWLWRPEMTDDTVVHGKGQFSSDQILDQKVISNDASDYVWYMTSLNLDKDDPIWSKDMSLRVNGTGHVLHAFANGKYLDSQWNNNSLFETNVKLNPGKNQITILSVTVGLQNYGSFFDLGGTGLYSVEIVGKKDNDETVTKSLASHKWSYKVGLNGEENKLFAPNDHEDKSCPDSQWQSHNLPIGSRMVWYKTSFKAPAGQDPVVVDLFGLGKGFAWVNGNNLGRYWLLSAEDDGCPMTCDYRGSYTNNKCLSNCGNPTQNLYHVPRSFLKDGDDENDLVLFEEIGGSPSFVNFKTVRAGSVCVNVYENKKAEISCQGRPISAIRYARFGDTRGTCGALEDGVCEGKNDAVAILQKECVGKEKCSVTASESVFGSTNCEDDQTKKLVVEAVC